MKERIKYSFMLILVLVMALLTFGGCSQPKKPTDPDGPEQPPEPPPHEHAIISDGSLCYFEEGKLYYNGSCECGHQGRAEITDYTLSSETTFEDDLCTGVDNRIIVLENDYYGYIRLNGVDSFDSGLTIIAKDRARIDGILITSGKTQNNADVEDDVMPSKLTLINITFEDSLHVRNCGMDGLTIYNCKFKNGARIFIAGNAYQPRDSAEVSKYGSDAPIADNKVEETRDGQYNQIKNVKIEKCEFTGEKSATEFPDFTKMMIFDVENLTIKDNYVESAGYSAIQLNTHGLGTRTSVVIANNTFENTYSRAIRIAGAKDNVNISITNNVFNDIAIGGKDKGEIIKITETNNTMTITFEGNILDDEPIAKGDAKVVIE